MDIYFAMIGNVMGGGEVKQKRSKKSLDDWQLTVVEAIGDK